MSESAINKRRSNQGALRLTAAGLICLALAAGFAGGRATVRATTGEPASSATPATVASPVPVLGNVPASYSGIVERVAPAVATIRVETRATATLTNIPEQFREFFGQVPGWRDAPRRTSGLGSGVVIRADGYVLTNHHVVADAESIHVDLPDGRSWPATLVGSDPASDLAVLRIKAADLPTVAYGDSNKVKVGDVVLAFGNPLGVGQTVTMGIVSAKGRATGAGDGSYEDFLQTDAPINRGNSGGALVDTEGRLVGINAQILSPSGGNIGLGFAIPSTMAQAVADQLIANGVVHRAKLGVFAQSLTPDLAASLGLKDTRGALVSNVDAGSPAASAGIRQGDVIVGLDDHPIADANMLRNLVASLRPGSTARVEVLRDGRREQLTARLAEREVTPAERARADAPATASEPSFGMSVEELTTPMARELGLPDSMKGVLVRDVLSDGAAASAGLQPGDVITRVDSRDVTTVEGLRSALRKPVTTPALVLVRRGEATIFVALPRHQS
jgi:Do/DeqQ family serine protease